MSGELGKKYPCFGEFKCPRCHKIWQSSKAWADYGQQCKFCTTSVIPFNLQRLFVYICGNCKTKWTWAYVAQGLQCRKCSSSTLVRPLDQRNYLDRKFIRAHRLEDLNNVYDENHIDPSKEHRQDLCEKCLILGRPCRESAGQESADQESVLKSNWPHQPRFSSSTSSQVLATSPSTANQSDPVAGIIGFVMIIIVIYIILHFFQT
jgi:DNA-directed RNA polymerase subunit RPC12/RpoP